MKRAISLGILALVTTASLASGDNRRARPVGDPTFYDFSGAALQSNPALLQQIDTTLIVGAGCRSMAALGYGNGYQCPPAGMAACMTMLNAGQVDACAQYNSRDYPTGCGTGESTSPAQRAASTCSDLSADLWNTLAIKIPFAIAKARLLAFGCTAQAGNAIQCPAHTREWVCMPFQRGGVVTCSPSPVAPPPSAPK
jgi:hypothetical protein